MHMNLLMVVSLANSFTVAVYHIYGSITIYPFSIFCYIYCVKVVAMASITLASKIEEAPRRIRDVANVFHHIKQIRNQK